MESGMHRLSGGIVQANAMGVFPNVGDLRAKEYSLRIRGTHLRLTWGKYHLSIVESFWNDMSQKAVEIESLYIFKDEIISSNGIKDYGEVERMINHYLIEWQKC